MPLEISAANKSLANSMLQRRRIPRSLHLNAGEYAFDLN